MTNKVSRRSVLAVPGAVLAAELTRSSDALAANYWALRHDGYAPVGYWQEWNNSYVCAASAGNAPLIANRSAIGEWEKFDFVLLGGQNIRLKAKINNKYVARQADERLKATSAAASGGTVFIVDTSGLSGGRFRLNAYVNGNLRSVYLSLNTWELSLSADPLKGFPAIFIQAPI